MARRRGQSDLREVLDEVIALGEGADPVAGLVHLVDALRPGDPTEAEARLTTLCDRLELSEPELRVALASLVRRVLGGASAVHALTECGVPRDHGFFEELSTRFWRRLLPDVDDPSDLRTIVRRVFSHRRDYLWLGQVEDATWRRLMDLLGFTAESVVGVPPELSASVRILAHHIASLGLSPEITDRMPQLDELDSPFLELSDRVRAYTESFHNAIEGDEVPHLDEALATLAACSEAVVYLRANKHLYGTSLRLTALSFRLLRQVERLEVLLHLTEPVQRDFQQAAITLFKSLVESENTRDHLGRHIKESADLLAYQVVEHAARKGSKYITTTRKEYGRFFLASVGGGLIVAIFALFKVLMDKLELSLAAEALLFSVNYSVCFVILYLTGAALATKQPAMTANTIARSMDGTSGTHQLEQLAEMIVRVWRSQFVSFVGNLIAAFPIAYLIATLLDLSGAPPADSVKAHKLLADVHPWLSGALFFAGVAGVYLFLSGLMSGYFDNRNLYRKLSERIARQPLLIRIFGASRAERTGKFIDKHGGALLGNIFLGFCLGTAGMIGIVLGLPYDIRHIAFSSANVGTGFALVDEAVPTLAIVHVAMGVVLIGFVNFIISFGLALSMALESRRLTFRENKAVVKILLKRLAKRPWDYFFPPRVDVEPVDDEPGPPGTDGDTASGAQDPAKA